MIGPSSVCSVQSAFPDLAKSPRRLGSPISLLVGVGRVGAALPSLERSALMEIWDQHSLAQGGFENSQHRHPRECNRVRGHPPPHRTLPKPRKPSSAPAQKKYFCGDLNSETFAREAVALTVRLFQLKNKKVLGGYKLSFGQMQATVSYNRLMNLFRHK